MKILTKGRIGALAALASALVLLSIFILFQLPNSTGNHEQIIKSVELNGTTRNILLIADENVLRIAPNNDLYPNGVWYSAMTFNGTIPGPLIIANQGDTLRITLQNDGKLVHSLNFHAGFGPSQSLSSVVRAGEKKTWTMKVNYPGAFLYHCDGDNLNGIWEHIASGMYGGMVIRGPVDPMAKEFFVTFSEVYDTTLYSPFSGNQSSADANDHAQAGSFDLGKFTARKPDLTLTNGMAFRYVPSIGTQARIVLNPNAEVFHAKTGELTRWYLFNAGPRNNIAFNFGAGLLKQITYSNPINSNGTASALSREYSQGYSDVVDIPPGSGNIVEVAFPEPGTYFGNDHDVGTLLQGSGFVVNVD